MLISAKRGGSGNGGKPRRSIYEGVPAFFLCLFSSLSRPLSLLHLASLFTPPLCFVYRVGSVSRSYSIYCLRSFCLTHCFSYFCLSHCLNLFSFIFLPSICVSRHLQDNFYNSVYSLVCSFLFFVINDFQVDIRPIFSNTFRYSCPVTCILLR